MYARGTSRRSAESRRKKDPSKNICKNDSRERYSPSTISRDRDFSRGTESRDLGGFCEAAHRAGHSCYENTILLISQGKC